MNKRKAAKITGWSLVLMAIIAGFSIGYAYSELYNPEQTGSIKDNLLDNNSLNSFMLLGILVILILDLVVSYSLFLYFKNDNKKVSLVSTSLRVLYTIVFGCATYFLAQNFYITEASNEIINENVQNFQSIWSAGLIIFGVHIFLVGYLMRLHKRIPAIFYYLTLLAGLSYILVHLLKLCLTQPDIVNNLEMILALPMALGELGLAIWLIVKGGKTIKNKTNH